MIKKIWLILAILFFQGCSEFVDAINNIQIPEWETEMSFHILEENVRISEKMTGDAFIAYDCTDTTLCDTSRGQIYMIEISDTIGTILVGDQLEFDDIHKEFNQSIDDVEISPLSTDLITEIGVISLGVMPPQDTPAFTFNDIMPAEVLSAANTAIIGGFPVEIGESYIEPVQQEFIFSSFSEAEISTSSIQLTITNNMFITLGDTINVELRNIESNAVLGDVSFYDEIGTDESSTEVLNLNGVTLPGIINIYISGKTLGTNGESQQIQSSDLDAGFYVSILINEMEVLSATANIPEQMLEKSGKFELSPSSNQVQLVSAIIEYGQLELTVDNGIPLTSELHMTIPGLTNENGPYTSTFQIVAANENSSTTTALDPESLTNYTLLMTNDSLEYFYTVTTSPDSVTISHTDMVNVELKISGLEETTGLSFLEITGYFNEAIKDTSQIELASETQLESAVIDSGMMSLSIINGLGLDAEISFSLFEFIDSTGNPLLTEFSLDNEYVNHLINLSGYTIQLPEGSAESVNAQFINYTSSVDIDSQILQTIDLNSGLTINVDITGLTFASVSGIVSPVSMDKQIEFPIELPQTIGDYSDQLSGFNFYKSNIELVIESSIEVPMSIKLNLKSYRTASTDIDDSEVLTYLDSASYDTTLIVNPYIDINVFNLANTENLLNIFPNKISANVHAEVGGGDEVGSITQASQLSGNINVKVPLAFILEDTIILDLDFSKTNPLDEKVSNIQHAEIISTISSNFGINFDVSAYVFADTLDTIPLDTLITSLAMNGGETTVNIMELDSTLLAIMMEDTTYIKPIISIMGNFDEDGNPLPFVIYSTDSIHLDITANANILIDSTMTNGGN
jgi:hypothetical protein